jgi:hypothetical protein
MKRSLVIAAMVLLAGMMMTACGDGNGDGDGGCPDIAGTYSVTKNITYIETDLGTAPGTSGIPVQTELDIEQISCQLVATEDGAIPYIGQSESGDTFYLDIENPENLAIEITLDIQGTPTTCKFNGSIFWDGDVLDSSNLSGYIDYDLDQHPEETKPECPTYVIIEMTFNAQEQ